MLKLFEGRNDKVSKLVKLGDLLGHSLRTNVNLFSVDSFTDTAIYLSEDEKIIKGNYSIKGNEYILENIEIEDAKVFSDDEKFDSYQKNQISLFVESLFNDDLNSAQNNFDGVLHLFEERARYNNTTKQLQDKSEVFNETHNIVNTPEAGRLFEVIPSLVNFLQEHKDQIAEIPEIHNAIKLSETVAKAFNVPTTTYDDLATLGRFSLVENSQENTYEVICQQELIRREILEAKDNFETVWATEPVIDKLTSKVNADDQEVAQALFEAIQEIPYLALVSKRKLSETVHNNLGEFADSISIKDMKNFVAKLFEMKKEYKSQLVKLLSEEYGINLQSIKEIPSFKSLLNTQVVIFEALSRISPKNSNMKKTLSEMATLLKTKNGVESLDVNNLLQQIFEAVGYSFENVPLYERFTFDDVSKTFTKIQEEPEDDEDVLAHEDEGEPEEKEEKRKSKKGDGEGEKKEEENSSEEESSDDAEKVEEEEEESETLSNTELMQALGELESIINGEDVPFEEED